MPRDSHPRLRQARELARKKPQRPAFDRLLIVTEGSKTEPNYFNEIRIQGRASNAHIAILPSEGTEPIQVVEYAQETFLRTREFERVYAVFDRDEHRTYNAALRRARELDNTLKNTERQKVRFFAVPSVPCFELWLVLHYKYLTAFSHRDDVINQARAYMPGYFKGMAAIYGKTESHLKDAYIHAERLRRSFGPDSGVDPYTDVDTLVQQLFNSRK